MVGTSRMSPRCPEPGHRDQWIRHTLVTLWEHHEYPGLGHHKETMGESWMVPRRICHIPARGHGVGTRWELFECTACLLAEEISEENCDGKISDMPRKYDCGVLGGYT